MYRNRAFGDPHSQYVVSVYFAIVTLTTLGYGDVLPTNNTERVFTVFLAISGAALFSFLISSISSLVCQGNAFEKLVHERMSEMTDLCRQRRLPQTLQVRARRQVAHLADRAPHLVQGLELLPRSLRNEMVELLTRNSVGLVPMFDALGLDGRARLAGVLRPCLFQPGQQIFHALDIGEAPQTAAPPLRFGEFSLGVCRCCVQSTSTQRLRPRC
jgi:voltage-gated potassium channel